MITQTFPGWALTEIKDMSVREREYWLGVCRFKLEYAKWQKMTQPNQA